MVNDNARVVVVGGGWRWEGQWCSTLHTKINFDDESEREVIIDHKIGLILAIDELVGVHGFDGDE